MEAHLYNLLFRRKIRKLEHRKEHVDFRIRDRDQARK